MASSGEPIVYRLILKSSPETVYEGLASDAGRASFWAEQTQRESDRIRFEFSDGQHLVSRVLAEEPGRRFGLTYFDSSQVYFDLEPTADGGTQLTLTEFHLPPENYRYHVPGWVSLLLTFKAALDYGVDLRNTNPDADWEAGFVDV